MLSQDMRPLWLEGNCSGWGTHRVHVGGERDLGIQLELDPRMETPPLLVSYTSHPRALDPNNPSVRGPILPRGEVLPVAWKLLP